MKNLLFSISGIFSAVLIAGTYSTQSLQTEIDIQASPDTVWATLTNFKEYPNWNPFIKHLSGELIVGAELSATLQAPGGKPMNFTPTIMTVDTGKEFRWLGKLFLPKIFDGEHYFIIEEKPDGSSRLIQGENFGGTLVHLIWPFIAKDTKFGFNLMNQALKNRAESEKP